MCEVATIATIGLAGAGTLTSMMSASARGNAAVAAARRNAATAEAQAADAVARGQLPAARTMMRGGQVIGSQQAHVAASGALVGVGSAGDLTRETRVLSQEDADVISNAAYREAYGYRTQAQRYRQEGEYAKSEADNAVLSSLIGGVGKVAGVAGRSWLEQPTNTGKEG